MSVTDATRRPVAVPSAVESPRAKLVYLYLGTDGASTVDTLATDLGMGKLALFSVLGTLANRGVVEAAGDTYRLA